LSFQLTSWAGSKTQWPKLTKPVAPFVAGSLFPVMNDDATKEEMPKNNNNDDDDDNNNDKAVQ
jgi:hypothetical protein